MFSLFALCNTTRSTTLGAQPECGVFFTTSPPHARCLTLTLAPNGAGAGCSLIRECRGQQPFRYPRVRSARHHARTLLFQITVPVTPCVMRGSGINDSRYRGIILNCRRFATRFGVRRHDDALIRATRRAVCFPRPRGFATAVNRHYHAQACSLGVPNTKRTRPHRADPWEHQVSALFGLRTRWDAGLQPDSTALQPLHCAAAIRFADYAIAHAAFRRSQTVETVRRISCARKSTKLQKVCRLKVFSQKGANGAFSNFVFGTFCVFEFRGGKFRVRPDPDSKNVETNFQFFFKLKILPP